VQLKLVAEKREPGRSRIGRARREGKLPAVVYGHRAAAQPLTLDGHEFQRVFARAGRTQLVDLVVEGGRAQKVLVREIQVHPRRTGPIHVDLYRVDLKEKLHADVPIVVFGESPAVKRGDGDPLQTLHAIKVECLPSDIPESVEVDLSTLAEVDAAIRVGELRLPESVTLLTDREEMVVKIAAKRVVEEVPEAEAAETEATAEAAEPSGEREAAQDAG
jgi:large subunit ribosomal protein L25